MNSPLSNHYHPVRISTTSANGMSAPESSRTRRQISGSVTLRATTDGQSWDVLLNGIPTGAVAMLWHVHDPERYIVQMPSGDLRHGIGLTAISAIIGESMHLCDEPNLLFTRQLATPRCVTFEYWFQLLHLITQNIGSPVIVG